MCVCSAPAGLSFGFASANLLTFAGLTKNSEEFAFAKQGECLIIVFLLHTVNAVNVA